MRTWWLKAALATALTLASVGQALPEDRRPDPPVTAYNGSFSYSVPIEVPAFRGLEPQLALSYGSSAGIRNISSFGGWLGYGWSLSGMSAIERVSGGASPEKSGGRGTGGYGTPAGMLADRFLLDGAEMVACSTLSDPTTVPSCKIPVDANNVAQPTLAGTHATRVESYIRIKQVDVRWEVTARDGTVSTYERAGALQPGEQGANIFRWYLKKTQDTQGNSVSYTYACAPDGRDDCLIASIVYKNTGSASAVATITFIAEARTDFITFATGRSVQNGVYGLRELTKRLRTIAVKHGASSLIRAYALSYDNNLVDGENDYQAPNLLTSVQEYGKDATVNETTGFITGDTKLPPTILTYNTAPTTFSGGWTTSTFNYLATLDFDGDGRTDILARSPSSSTAMVRRSTGAGFAAIATATVEDPAEKVKHVGDFNGDGRDDFLFFTSNAGLRKAQVGVASGSEFVIQSWAHAPDVANGDLDGDAYKTGDFDGDGRLDFFSKSKVLWRAAPNGSFVKQPNWTVPPVSGPMDDVEIETGDVNGDGKTDLLVSPDGGFFEPRIWLSTGSDFIEQAAQSLSHAAPNNIPTNATRRVGDVNGDGMADLVYIWEHANDNYKIRVLRSRGNGFDDPIGSQFFPLPDQDWGNNSHQINSAASGNTRLADFNGDERADIAVTVGTGSYLYALSDGEKFIARNPASQVFGQVHAMADFDGDGRTDFLRGTTPAVSLSSGGYPYLLTQVKEPLGGSISVEYATSSGTSGTILPFAMQTVSAITTNDGRGTTTSLSETDFTYVEGKWSYDERTFMGFRQIVAKKPQIATEIRPEVRTTYRQDIASLGRIGRVEHFDGTAGATGAALRDESHQFTLNSTAPFESHATTSDYFNRDGGGSKIIRVTRNFDMWGIWVRSGISGFLASDWRM